MRQLAELRAASSEDPERGYPTLSHAPSRSTPDAKASTTERLEAAAETVHFDGYETVVKFYEHFRAKSKEAPGWVESIKNAVFSSCGFLFRSDSLSTVLIVCSPGLNVLFIFIPFAWACHFENDDGHWPHQVTFACKSCLYTRERPH